jgi:hypothetical protein
VGNSQLYTTLGFDDKDYSTTENVNFEVSSIIFIPNYIAQDQEIEDYRVIRPRRCSTACNTNCVNQVCKATDRFFGYLNIGAPLKIDDSAIVSLTNINMFKPVINFVPQAESTPTFTDYLVSLDFDVNAYFSSSFTQNQNVIFAITNENKEEYLNLSNADVFPTEITSESSIALVIDRDGKLQLNHGYISWEKAAQVLDLQLGEKSVKDFSRIYISIRISYSDSESRVLIIADDIEYVFSMGSTSKNSPLNLFSLIYNHPSISNLNLNIIQPRLDTDVQKHAVAHLAIDYPSKLCESINSEGTCKNCVYPEFSNTGFCTYCATGYHLINGVCVKSEQLSSLTLAIDLKAQLQTQNLNLKAHLQAPDANLSLNTRIGLP